MDSQKPAQKTEWGQLMAMLRWMEAEGLVELYYDEKGRECVRITPAGMDFEFSG